MIQRKTQTPRYWQDELRIDERDLEAIYQVFLEDERPRSLGELALVVIEERCRREEEELARELEKGKLYQPRDGYKVGERLVFPALAFAVGTVVGVREGHNPEYGTFKVIQVELEGDGVREFAAELEAPHALNLREGQQFPWEGTMTLAPDALYTRYGDVVAKKLAVAMEQSGDFVHFRDLWLPKMVLADVHVGHLNIAEAMLDVRGEALSPEQLLEEIELPAEVRRETQVFSLNVALAGDKRFVDVGDAKGVRWFLRRMLPEAVFEPPIWLRYEELSYDQSVLSNELLILDRELSDELSPFDAPPAVLGMEGVEVTLTYPHRRGGTLPLNQQTRFLFPVGGETSSCTMVRFVDRAGGEEFPGWVVYPYRYVYGLGEWYDRHELLAGALVRLERTDDPYTVAIDFIPRRMRGEWVRVATLDESGQVVFEMKKRPVAFEYDELMVVDEEEPGELLKASLRDRSLTEVVLALFPELAKLNPQGTVHGKTLYSAVNMVRRCPPGPIFVELLRQPYFISVGNGYWKLDAEALKRR